MRNIILLFMGLFVAATLSSAAVLNVPEDFETIQAGIDAAEDGDTVLVAPGVYEENITTAGKDTITLASQILTTGNPEFIERTIIDGGGDGAVVQLRDMQRYGYVLLRGFTICNGHGEYAGGIEATGATYAEMVDLVVTGNRGGMAAGIGAISIWDAHFRNVRAVANNGTGVYTSATRTSFQDCDFSGNEGKGGELGAGTLTVRNTSFLDNAHTGLNIWVTRYITLDHLTIAGTRRQENQNGHGLRIYQQSQSNFTASLANSIIYSNEGSSIVLREGPENSVGTLSVSYSDVEGGLDGIVIEEGGEPEVIWGEGNIDADPLFVDPDNGDYHLTEDSPCIDTGDPEAEPDPDGSRADMGAFWFRPWGNLIEVPADFEAIQDAIRVAEEGDTVLVHPGTYHENIDFLGKSITVASLYLTTGDPAYRDSTFIDGHSIGTVVTFENGETADALLTGFTITRGNSDGNGGGVRCSNSSPSIIYNRICFSYAAARGGGVSCEPEANPIITDCLIDSNSVGSGGGGVWIGENSHPTIERSLITGNAARWNGGGINMYHGCQPFISDCQITDNQAHGKGGGIIVSEDCEPVFSVCIITGNFSEDVGGGAAVERNAHATFNRCFFTGNRVNQVLGLDFAAIQGSNVALLNCTITWPAVEGWTYSIHSSASDVVLVNSIIWGETPLGITFNPDSAANSLTIAYCDIAGGWEPQNCQLNWLEGNIGDNPQFDDDYHLTERSPCVDAGTSFFIWGNDTLVNLTEDDFRGLAPDMGAFESEYINETERDQSSLPLTFTIHSIYPNPFNSTTTITYSLPYRNSVSLSVFDLSGRLVDVLYDGVQVHGVHSVHWSAEGLPSGVYLARLTTPTGSAVSKVLLVR